jgi:hypothetical protein
MAAVGMKSNGCGKVIVEPNELPQVALSLGLLYLPF